MPSLARALLLVALPSTPGAGRSLREERSLIASARLTHFSTEVECDVMPRKFKPLRFFVMVAVAAFVVCGVTAFYTQRTAHGRTPEEQAAYWIGEKAGEGAPRDAKLPTAAELNLMAQKNFEQHGSGNKQDWDLAFEHGYEEGFKKIHPLATRSSAGTAH